LYNVGRVLGMGGHKPGHWDYLCASTLRNFELRTAVSISAIQLGDGTNSRGTEGDTIGREEMTHCGARSHRGDCWCTDVYWGPFCTGSRTGLELDIEPSRAAEQGDGGRRRARENSVDVPEVQTIHPQFGDTKAHSQIIPEINGTAKTEPQFNRNDPTNSTKRIFVMSKIVNTTAVIMTLGLAASGFAVLKIDDTTAAIIVLAPLVLHFLPRVAGYAVRVLARHQ
jgi:hypothetical protein